ncbi:MAG: TRAP transporter small permease [Desulfarculaceae bacterium]|jgi:TRAP-type C4-dicarboxylate transport system permease small subunit
MNRLLQITDKVSTYAAWISGTVLLLTSFMIAVEVILRKVFIISMGGADEISSYALAMSCSWAFGYALFRKSHIRIDVLYLRLPQAARFFLDIVSLCFFGLYLLLLTYFAYLVLYTSLIRHSMANTPLATPLWIPQSLWFIGIVGFLLTIFLILAGTIYNLISGDLRRAQELSGAVALEEEIEEGTSLAETGNQAQGGAK